MQNPTLKEEKRLWRRGYRKIIGTDEVGRGAVAGNVTAAAISFTTKINISPKLKNLLATVKDSKKLTPKKREAIFRELKQYPEVEWKIAKVSARVIDRINIQRASELATIRAVKKFNSRPDFVIIDGSRFFSNGLKNISYKTLVRADEKTISCALASIVAKVTRDRTMVKLARKFPDYGFETHKGYGTKKHCEALEKFGPCEIHRKSFKPIR